MVTQWTSPSGETVTHHGTTTLGAITVQAGQPLTVEHYSGHGEVTGFVCDSLVSYSDVNINCRRSRIRGNNNHNKTLTANNAIITCEHHLILDHAAHTQPIVELIGTSQFLFGNLTGTRASLHAKFF